jgi:outer membrane immunogenic protein
MRKILLCGVAAAAVGVAWTGAAQAESTYDWTGFYAGANVGYGAAYYSGKNNASGASADGLDLSGVVGGLHGGYNHQIDSLVLGVEGDVSFFDWQDRKTEEAGAEGDSGDMNLLASVRARLGYAFDRGLVFATGGVAFSDANYSGFDSGSKGDASVGKVGGVVGGGLEWAVMDNVSVRAEGLYYMFGDKKDTSSLSPTARSGDYVKFEDAFTFRVGATFHFNGI